MKYSYTEYMFASARLKAADGKGTARERLLRMCEARSCEELAAVIGELFSLSASHSSPEDAISDVMLRSYALLDEAVPDVGVYGFLKYKYDCCNIKLAIKSHILKADHSELYCKYGSVPPSLIGKMPESGDFSALPPNMALSAPRSLEIYLKSGEARAIDILNDAACFEDTIAAVDELGNPELSSYYSMRADIVNILTYLRLDRRGGQKEARDALIRRSLVSGGRLPKELFTSSSELDLSSAEKYWGHGALTFAIKALKSDPRSDLSLLEKKLDDISIAELSPLKYKQFGVEVPAYFILMREFEMKNARLIASGIRHGADHETLKERLCTAYV